MYCNRCGKPVDDDDRFCRNCGNELKRAIDEASRERNNTSMTFTSPSDREEPKHDSEDNENSKSHRISTDEFVWNIHTFDKPSQKKEEVYVDWSKGQVVEIDLTAENSPTEQKAPIANTAREEIVSPQKDTGDQILREDFQSLKMEHPEPQERASLKVEEKEIATLNEDIPVTIDDIKRDVEEGNTDLKRATARIDKFYTFNQKNEQFQKLLDKEYERVHGSVPPDTAEIYLEFERLTGLDLPQNANASDEQERLNTSIHTQAGLTANVQEAQELEQKESTPVNQDSDADSKGAAVAENLEIDGQAIAEKKEAFDPVEHIKQATIARQEELAKAGIFENSALVKKFDTMQLEKDLIGNAFVDDKSGRKFESAILNELFGEIKKTDIESVSLDGEDSPVKEEAAQGEQSDKAVSTEPQDLGIVASVAVAENMGGEQKTEENKTENEADTVIPNVAKDLEKQKGKGGRYFGRTLLVIALIVFLASMAAVGITKLAPDSKAAGFIYEEVQPIVEKAFSSVAGLFDGSDKKTDEENKDGENIDTSGKTAPLSMTTQEIISSQLGNNANIAAILPDINIGYDKSKDYGNKDINESIILSQKYPDVDEYNKKASEIVGTLIKFDSQWIDYVNTKDRAVFDILKKDSNAYRNCMAFKKAGIVKKEFKELRIGQMRSGVAGYYVWADEKIVTIENGKSSEDNHSWIYYFESDGAEMRVVDYIRDK
ncbi:MAG: zinc ribbon domain-containing protein [Eubacteriales bacterium]|nr:zinc ribbon domain-containing protein [Eubacteriales bacterium]MDD4389763.1 zinc ribbon domain-containing protein [Eubacteriales bacterium]